MRHKFMFALQKNVNSPIRSSIAKIWLKFIENPLVNAISLQDSFSRGEWKRAFVARGIRTMRPRSITEREIILEIISFLSSIIFHLFPTFKIRINKIIRIHFHSNVSRRCFLLHFVSFLWKDFKSHFEESIEREGIRKRLRILKWRCAYWWREQVSVILAGDRSDRGRSGPGSNLARDDRIARVVNEFR